MQFMIARVAAHTGALLRQLVNDEMQRDGIRAPADAVVCYGAGTAARAHVLNATCSRMDKLEQGRHLQDRLGANALAIITDRAEAIRMLANNPLLARKTTHTKGRDIMLVLEDWQVGARLQAGANFFTPYLRSTTEYRTWVYRNRILGTYEKVLAHPNVCAKLGRNHANGFDFSFRENENVPEGLKDVARRAISALGLDFGAVDVLLTAPPNPRYVVLEVNAAPGVQDERRRVIQVLAHRIARWAHHGCPDRRVDGGAE